MLKPYQTTKDYHPYVSLLYVSPFGRAPARDSLRDPELTGPTQGDQDAGTGKVPGA